MAKGKLVQLNNLVKWILETENTCDCTEVSGSFEIQYCKCTFSFNYGYRNRTPISLLINFHGKEKFNSPVDVLIVVSSNSKMLPPERHCITGGQAQMIWSSTDYDLRGYLLTFEMFMHNGISKDNKSTQTPSYIDNCFLMDGISNDFSKFLDEDMKHDVEFTCGDKTVKAHKNVLCSRSSVFASMLRSDMVEGMTGRVNIKDMEANIFQQFLRCLYTGILPRLTLNNAMEFYNAGDKYNIIPLKKQCAEFLTDNLSSDNVCDILIMADLHSDSDFKKDIMEYMLDKKIPLIGEKWVDFCKENPVLANEVLNLFCHYLSLK